MKKPAEHAAVVALFLRVAEGWPVTEAQLGALLGVTATTIARWKRTPPRQMSEDCEVRAALLLEIDALGRRYFGTDTRWLTLRQPQLGGSLLSTMARGE